MIPDKHDTSMRTVDSVGDASTSWGRLRRDLSTLRRIAGMVLAYATIGGRIRREYRAKEEAGETYWVDGLGG